MLHAMGYIRNANVHVVTRDDLVGQFIGHTAPKTKEAIAKAAGGVLFIDEAYYLFRPENERDYGQEAIEILLQEMENERAEPGGDLRRLPGPDGHLLLGQPGAVARGSPHHIDVRGLHPRRAGRDRRADGGRRELPVRRRCAAGLLASTWSCGCGSRGSPTRAACATPRALPAAAGQAAGRPATAADARTIWSR